MNAIMESANNVGDTALALSPSFGIPATVCTNVSRAAGIDLVTRVRLAAGVVTLTAVLWRGNESQMWIPKIPFVGNANGYATPNYHQNGDVVRAK